MTSRVDAQKTPRTDAVHRLCERLDLAEALSVEMRNALKQADATAIESATARMETLALEFKVLDAEYRRLPPEDPDAREPGIDRALTRLNDTSTRLARSAAIGGGLLERLVSMSRQLIGALQGASGETYLPSGRTRDLPTKGLRLAEEA